MRNVVPVLEGHQVLGQLVTRQHVIETLSSISGTWIMALFGGGAGGVGGLKDQAEFPARGALPVAQAVYSTTETLEC